MGAQWGSSWEPRWVPVVGIFPQGPTGSRRTGVGDHCPYHKPSESLDAEPGALKLPPGDQGEVMTPNTEPPSPGAALGRGPSPRSPWISC